MKLKSLLSAALLVSMFSACSSDDESLPFDSPSPLVHSFSPETGMMTDRITIEGENFGTGLTDNVVQFGNTPAVVESADVYKLVVVVPDSARTGRLKVTVNGKAGTSSKDFVILSPTVESVSPTFASPGMAIAVAGSNFLPDAARIKVFVGSVAAEVQAVTDDALTFIVPDAATTDKVMVQVGTQNALSEETLEICSGKPELIISDISIISATGNEVSFSFKFTNVGNVDLDLSKMIMQNYVSADDVLDNGDAAAGGTFLTSGGILEQGESYESSWSSTVDYSSKPYLIVTVFANNAEEVTECNTANNVWVQRIVE